MLNSNELKLRYTSRRHPFTGLVANPEHKTTPLRFGGFFAAY
jgi:hypothetical protein